MGTEPGLLQDRLQAHAAGEDQTNPALMFLTVLAQPTQELVHRLPSLRRDAVVIPLEQTIDENRQLVDGQHYRPAVLRQGRENLIASLPPVSRINPGSQFHLYF